MRHNIEGMTPALDLLLRPDAGLSCSTSAGTVLPGRPRCNGQARDEGTMGLLVLHCLSTSRSTALQEKDGRLLGHVVLNWAAAVGLLGWPK